MELKNLAKKMLAIMSEVGYVQKKGVNTDQKYRYAKGEDIVGVVSRAMIKHNVMMFSTMEDRQHVVYKTFGGKDSFLVTVKIKVKFVDVDSGEQFESTYFGDGSDANDKASNKAVSAAIKYVLLKNFLIETGDDSEANAPHDPGYAQNQRHQPYQPRQAANQASKNKPVAPAAPAAPAAPVDAEALRNMLKEQSMKGYEQFVETWKSLTDQEKDIAKEWLEELKSLCDQADTYNARKKSSLSQTPSMGDVISAQAGEEQAAQA